MKRLFPILAFAFLAPLACTRGPTKAQIGQDFNAICQAQKTFLQSKSLLKQAKEADLRLERNRVMGEGRLTEPGLQAVALVVAAGTNSPRVDVESAAKAAGLENWVCPEL
jgi:hypothetical protein